ncbi:MAG: glycosyl hydrolase family 18 protein [Patescibacteria group bacterium]
MRRLFLFTIPVFLLISFFVPGAVFAARTLSVGSSGADVVVLQDKLIVHGYLAAGLNIGRFGPATETALKKFQCANGIVCSGSVAEGYGVYGPRTQAALALATNYPKNPASISENLTPVAVGAFETSGWIPYWRATTGTQDVLPNLSKLTSVMPFGYTLKTDGTLADTAKLTEEPWVPFIAAARAAKVRIVPTVMSGDGDIIHRILSDTRSRIALEDEIANVVKQNGFDGIDVDFEAKNRETINYFSTFLKGLYARMGNKWVYCTIEARMPLEHRYLPGQIIPPDATDYANDYKALNKYCDRVEIMAYDQGIIDQKLNGQRAAPYAPTADTEWVEALVRLAAQTISRNKLIIGIPTYGYEYKVTPLSNGAYQYKVLWPFNPKYATDMAQKLNITPFRNSAGEMGFVYYLTLLQAPSGTESTLLQQTPENPSATITQNANGSSTTIQLQPFNYVSWSDAQAIKDKVDLAKILGVRGVAVFKFDGGEDQGTWNVLR